MRDDLEAENQAENVKLQSQNSDCEEKIKELTQTLTLNKEQKANFERLIPLKQEELKDKQRQADDKLTEEERNLLKVSELTQ